MKKLLALAAGLALSVHGLPAGAENATPADGYTIHHNALTTDMLAPNVAKVYNIQRSKSRGMLNVSVIKEQPGTTGTPVKAEVKARATNLTGQARDLELREIMDGDAIYYIGEMRVANQETLNFDLEVKPVGSAQAYRAKFSQTFYTD